MLSKLTSSLDVANSGLTSSLNGWRGMMTRRRPYAPMPELKLYDCETDAECRLVRDVLTELYLDVDIRPCPAGGQRFKEEMQPLGHGSDTPVLHDVTAGKSFQGAALILHHLFLSYGGGEVPGRYQDKGLMLARKGAQLASLIRSGEGLQCRPSRVAEKPLELWSFEASPYSRRVRERLCEYQLPYRLYNLGKEQVADLGPPNARFKNPLTPYVPVRGGRREIFLAEHGRVQVPYLRDPNAGIGLFESDEILRFLDQQYGDAAA